MARPNAPCGAELRDLLEEVVMNIPEERKARRKGIDIEPARNPPFNVGESVRQGKRQFLRRRGTGLADMVSGNRNGIPVRGVRRAPFEAVND